MSVPPAGGCRRTSAGQTAQEGSEQRGTGGLTGPRHPPWFPNPLTLHPAPCRNQNLPPNPLLQAALGTQEAPACGHRAGGGGELTFGDVRDARGAPGRAEGSWPHRAAFPGHWHPENFGPMIDFHFLFFFYPEI